ncbi:MAG: HAD-IIB family hydrolase [Selenomonadaceae bacterium]|nr:HAD-IIB family hydrolase [Selenomonadaceae bacterium]
MKWWKKKSVYQIYPKSFLDTTGTGTGDLRGVIRKLDYIKNLGAGAIWLTPFYPSPQVDNGYDISDYTAIDPRYGTMKDFDELVAEAKKRDIKIVVDLVFNHTSDKHAWFLESKSSRDNPKADWYIWRDDKTNWRSIFGGSAWTWCKERQQYYLHTFAKEQPDLNWENPEVRQALCDAANFWADRGAGGFRIDAIVYIKKPKIFVDGEVDSEDGLSSIHNMIAATDGILDFLRELKEKVFDGRDIFTVAEANGVQPENLSEWVGDNGVFDMLFEFSHVNIMFERGVEIWHRAKHFRLSEWKKTLTESQLATRESWYPIYFENHDRPRSVNTFFPYGSDKILAAKALATTLFTLRGTPFIYQGEELGFENTKFNSIDDYDDISSRGNYDLARADGLTDKEAMRFVHRFSRDNARTPMQWSSEKNSGFSSGKPWLPIHENFKTCNVELEEHDKNSVLNFYRQLSALRNSNEVLISGDYQELLPNSDELFIFTRTLGDKRLCTAVNFSTREVSLPEKFFVGAKKIFGNYPDEKNYLRPTEAAIYEIPPDKSFKVAASDFDGTLFRKLDIPPEDLQAIKNWRAAGNKFGIVTGRTFVMLKNHLQDFDLEVDFAICCNGAIIYDGAGKIIFETEIPKNILLELMNEPCTKPSFHFAFETADEVFYCRTSEKSWLFREYDKWSFALTKIDDSQILTLGKKINQLALDFANPEETAQAAEAINKKFGDVVFAQKNTHSVDIVSAGLNKARGVENLLQVMNWDAEVFVIGDESNDLPMINHFGGYTVITAKDFFKKKATAIFDSVGAMLNYFG